jgi:hypothetical protein
MNKPTVFFSHSSLDKEIAKSLKDKLIEYTGGTVQIFVSSDGESIPFGKNWLSTIERGLEESRIMFLLVTPNSINNLWLSFEAGFGYSKNIRVIPLCFKVSVSDLKYPLGMLQGYDLQSADSFNNIISILNSEFDYSHKLSFTESDFSEISSIGITDDVNQEFAKIVKEVTWYKNFQPSIIESLEGEELTLYNKICSGLLSPTEEFLQENQVEYSIVNRNRNSVSLNFCGIFLTFSLSKEEEETDGFYYPFIKIEMSPHKINVGMNLLKRYLKRVLCCSSVDIFVNIHLPYNFRAKPQDVSALLMDEHEFQAVINCNAFTWRNIQFSFFKTWSEEVEKQRISLKSVIETEKLDGQNLQDLIAKLIQLEILYIDDSLFPDQIAFRKNKEKTIKDIEKAIEKRENEIARELRFRF